MPSSAPRRGALAVAAFAAAVALILAPATAATADIPTTITRGDVGLNLRYDFADKAPEWTLAYPYRIVTANNDRTLAYCVQWHVSTEDGVAYSEGTWDGIANLQNVNWILQNGAPTVSNADLTAAAEAHSGLTLDEFTDFQARGATQLAIWSYTDGFEIDRVMEMYEHVGGGASQRRIDIAPVKALVDYLTDPAINVGLGEPTVSIMLDSSAATWDGAEYGPIHVLTNAPEVVLTATGADVVDAAGTPVTTTTHGSDVYLRTAPGTTGAAQLVADAPGATLSAGRVLLAPGMQTLIVADSLGQLATYALDVALTPELASTGPVSEEMTPIAGALLALGGALVAVAMIRRARMRVGRHSIHA